MTRLTKGTSKPATRRALGRGLGALIPNKEPSQPDTGGGASIPVGSIAENPYQPRKTFHDKALAELADSIREHGIIQPLIVSRIGDSFQLIAGERRLRAARLLGLETVPVVIRGEMAKDGALAVALIENIQREDLNAIEEARAYEQLHEEFGLTQAEIAKRVGRERSTIANSLRLLKLPETIQSLVATGELSMGHARPLLTLGSAREQESLARRVVRDGLSARQVEAIVSGTQTRTKKQKKPKDVFTRDAEEKLRRALRTRVEINRRNRGGTIQIAFSSEDELIRLYEMMAGGRRSKR